MKKLIGLIVFRIIFYSSLLVVSYYRAFKSMIENARVEGAKTPLETPLVFLFLAIAVFLYFYSKEESNKIPIKFILFEMGYFVALKFFIDALILFYFYFRT